MGETHGTGCRTERPWKGRTELRQHVRPFQGRSVRQPVPWVSPTAIHVEPLRGSGVFLNFSSRLPFTLFPIRGNLSTLAQATSTILCRRAGSKGQLGRPGITTPHGIRAENKSRGEIRGRFAKKPALLKQRQVGFSNTFLRVTKLASASDWGTGIGIWECELKAKTKP